MIAEKKIGLSFCRWEDGKGKTSNFTAQSNHLWGHLIFSNRLKFRRAVDFCLAPSQRKAKKIKPSAFSASPRWKMNIKMAPFLRMYLTGNDNHPISEGGVHCQRRFIHSVIININQRSPAERGPFRGPSSIHQLCWRSLIYFLTFHTIFLYRYIEL